MWLTNPFLAQGCTGWISSDTARKVGGLTLIELLVGVALGALVLSGALALFTVSAHSARTQSALIEVTESGQFGVDFMRQAIRRAGAGVRVDGVMPYQSVPPVIWSMTEDAEQFDTLTLQYVTGAAGGYTCTGSRAEPHTAYFSQYTVAPFTKDPSLMQLVCRTGPMATAVLGNTALAPKLAARETGIILSGVEAFAIRYYVSSKLDVSKVGVLTAADIDPVLNRLTAIEVGLLLKNTNGPAHFGLASGFSPMRFSVLDQIVSLETVGRKPDARLRRVFEFSVFLESAFVPRV